MIVHHLHRVSDVSFKLQHLKYLLRYVQTLLLPTSEKKSFPISKESWEFEFYEII